MSLPPGDLGLPYIGKTVQFSMNPEKFLRDLPDGPVVKTNLFNVNTAVVGGREESAKIVAGENRTVVFDFSTFPNGPAMIGDRAMICRADKDHADLRRHANRCINPESLDIASTKIQNILSESISSWEREGVTDGNEWSKHAAGLIACSFCGIDDAPKHPKWPRIRRQIQHQTLAIVAPAIEVPFYKTNLTKGKENTENMFEMIRIHLRKRQAQMDGGETLPNDLMQQLIHSLRKDGERLEDNLDLVHNLNNIFGGALDAPTAHFNRFLELMCRNPEAQAKARAEIQKHFGDYRGPITREQLRECEYVTLLNLEVLRHQTTPVVTFRRALKDFELGGYLIPEGWRILVRQQSIAFDSQIYKDPHKFEPERFGPDRAEHKTRGTFTQFGFGVHRCYGERLADLERDLLTVMLLRDYEISFENGVEPSWGPARPMRYINSAFPIRIRRVCNTPV